MQPVNIKLKWVNKIVIAILFVLLFYNSFAQPPTKAESDKIMKEAQERIKKYGNDSARVKALQHLLDQQKKITDAMKNQPQNNNGSANKSSNADPGEYSNVDNWKFPAKNIAMLSSLPKKLLTRIELVNFLNEVYNGLAKKLSPGISSSVQSITAKCNNDGNRMGDVAVAGWYTNYREESLLLIIKAAATNPDNGILLNNCAALLNMSGIEQTAIPVLKYILQSYPSNGMVLNNLGQAYAGLGETDTAMYYLRRCLKTEPENVEANNTAGQIEATKGNTNKAIEYFQQSIKGGYNKPAVLKLRKIKKGSKIASFVKPRIKIPEYFNQFKYKLPQQCTNVDNAARASAEFSAFHKTILDQNGRYSNKQTALQTKLAAILQKEMDQQNMGNPSVPPFRKDDFAAQPFHELCGIMIREVDEDYYKEIHDIIGVDKKYYVERSALEKEYKRKLDIIKKDFHDSENKDCCGEGNVSCCISDEIKCKAYDGLANEYLPKFAILTEDWQEKNQLAFRKYFDDLVYWSYLDIHPLPHGDDNFHISFYGLVEHYLSMLDKIGRSKIIEPCYFKPTNATIDSNAIKEIECPLDISIPFGIGIVKLNCEKFYLSLGEGVVFHYEKNLQSKQSTISLGLGVILEIGGDIGPVKAKETIGADESFFITLDGHNGIADGGLKFTAKAGVGVGPARTKEEVGYTVGINSGWDFNEGPFKGMIGPAPEVQQNKNVKIYKPN